jgi:hypothetical protein
MQVGPHYQGALSQYRYRNPEISDLLKFLAECKNPEKIWLGDNLIWPNTVPDSNYDTYVFGFFGENFDYHYLEEVNRQLAGKKILVLTSCPDTSRFELDNIKTFYVEHLHTYLRLYPRQLVKPVASRTHSVGMLSGIARHHRVLALAKLLTLVPNAFYSFNSKLVSQECTAKQFCQTMQHIILNDYIPADIQPCVDQLLNGELDHVIAYDNHFLRGWSINNPAYTNCQFNISAETAYYSHPKNVWQYLTEKTFKCLVSGTPFVVLGQKNSHQRLVDLGFKIAHSNQVMKFDSAEDCDRIYKFFDHLEWLIDNLDVEHLQQVADFNYNYVYGDFYSICNNQNLAQAEKIISYIHG